MSSIITRKSEHFEDPEVFNPERFSPATKYIAKFMLHIKCIVTLLCIYFQT